MSEPKERLPRMALVIRRDLKMRRGKEIGQGLWAGIGWLRDMLYRGVQGNMSEEQRKWVYGDTPVVIVFQTEDEASLLDIERRAKEAGLKTHVQRDAGLTEVEAGTPTALGIGPAWPEDMAKVTADLKLY